MFSIITNTISIKMIIKKNKIRSLINVKNINYKFFSYLYISFYIIKNVLGKFIYLLLILFMSKKISGDYICNFNNIIFFLSLGGGYLNNKLLSDFDEDIILSFNLNRNKYRLGYYLFLSIISILILLPLLLMTKVSIFNILLPFFIMFIKIIITYFSNKYCLGDSNVILFISVLISLIGFILSINNICVGEYIYDTAMIIFIIFGIYFIQKLNRFNYKENKIKIVKKTNNTKSTICVDNNEFNNIFIKRNKIYKLSIKMSMIIIVFFLFLYMINISYINYINDSFYIALMGYLINLSGVINEKYYKMCDSCMLSYGFYHISRILLDNYKRRILKQLLINMIPSLILIVCCVLLFNNYSYILLIILSCIYFTITQISLYYLIQPYSMKSDYKTLKYYIFNFIITGIYFVFSSNIIIEFIITIIVLTVCIFLVCKYAEKTFITR